MLGLWPSRASKQPAARERRSDNALRVIVSNGNAERSLLTLPCAILQFLDEPSPVRTAGIFTVSPALP